MTRPYGAELVGNGNPWQVFRPIRLRFLKENRTVSPFWRDGVVAKGRSGCCIGRVEVAGYKLPLGGFRQFGVWIPPTRLLTQVW